MRCLVATLLIGLTSSSLGAQKAYNPNRPRLPAGADTNSAQSYYAWGLNQLNRNPDQAAAAFHWATRIDPSMAGPLYAKRVALLVSNGPWLERYFENRNVRKGKEARAIDTLQYEALIRNPLLNQQLNRIILEKYFEQVTGLMATQIRWDQADPAQIAWVAHSDGDYGRAIDLYAKAIKAKPKDYDFRVSRALAFVQLSRYDSAAAELQLVLDELRKRDARDLIYAYDSKALYEYSLGMVYVRAGNIEKAREALGRALTEDLAFYMAHAALGDVAYAQKDTATALQELELAVQLRGDDAALRWRYGAVLLESRRFADAEIQLAKAVELAPFFAVARYALARTLDGAGKKTEAVAEYSAFIGRASRELDEQVAHARNRVNALKAGSEP